MGFTDACGKVGYREESQTEQMFDGAGSLKTNIGLFSPVDYLVYFLQICLNKDSYRNEQNTPTLIFENLKPVEISKKYFNII